MSAEPEIRFAHPLPAGYSVVWSEATEHYQWINGERESDITCDRWAAWRGAWADHRAKQKEPVA